VKTWRADSLHGREGKTREVVTLREFYAIIKYFLLLLITLQLSFVTAKYFLDAFFSPAKVLVPDLVGLYWKEAAQRLNSIGLNFVFKGEEYNDKYPKGVVIKQYPEASREVKKGRRVFVVLSKGLEKALVPDLRGKLLSYAVKKLNSLGLKVGNITYLKTDNIWRNKYPDQSVIAMSAKPGSKVYEGESVDLLVASDYPPYLVAVPNLIGTMLSEATEKLKNLDLKLGRILYQKTDRYPEGMVLAQMPEAKTILQQNSAVDVVVAGKQIARGKVYHFTFTVPSGSLPKEVKILKVDDNGVKVIYDSVRDPSESIAVDIKYSGSCTILVYVDGILVQEKRISE